jgi:ABC-type lipoprotein export system ATPase subunit
MNVAASNLCFKGQKNSQLHSINFNVASGQCLIISGISGSGKSLLLGLICGLVNLNSGVITFNGLTTDDMTSEQEIQFKKQLGVIFQKPALLSNLTLKENLLLPLIQHFPELPASERTRMVEIICQKFELHRHLEDRIEELSQGLQSLASFARALICRPDLLIWDAPLADIDANWSNRIIDILKQFKKDNKTIILFTNRKRIITELADIHLHLVNGTLETSEQIMPVETV